MGQPVTNSGRALGSGIHGRESGYERPLFPKTGIAEKKQLLRFYEFELKCSGRAKIERYRYKKRVRELRKEIQTIEQARKEGQ